MKYRLTDETIVWEGHTLHRIEALMDFGDVNAGDKGGWIEKEYNLWKSGDCWVYDDAKVYGDAEVYGHAKVYGDAEVYGCAEVYGYADVYGYAEVYDQAKVCNQAKVYGKAKVFADAVVLDDAVVCGDVWVFGIANVCGDAKIESKEDYIVFKNWWSSGRYFTWTRSNNMWKVGCFYGTGEELIKKAYRDSQLSGREYERIVKYVESILSDNEK